jgi:hypothetical protein
MLPKKSLTSFLVDERGKRSLFRSLPGVQLDRKRTLINASLKRWRIPQIFCSDRYNASSLGSTRSALWANPLELVSSIWRFNKTNEPRKGVRKPLPGSLLYEKSA